MKVLSRVLKFVLTIFFRTLFYFVPKRKGSESLRSAIDLYKNDGFGRLFAEIRAWDAPYEEIEKLVPKKGEIIDLGSGDGLLANFLAISSKKRKVYGIELRKNRAKASYKGIPNAQFKQGDALNENYPGADCFIMFHLLHHLGSEKNQESLIAKVSRRLSKGGRVLVVEIAQKPVLKYAFCFLVDAFILPMLFDKKLYDFDFRYRSVRNWEMLLQKNGFKFKSKLIDKGMPFPHVIIDAVKD